MPNFKYATDRPLLLSIKPSYADLIFRGSKTVELRKRVPEAIEGRDVFIYVSSPVCALCGGFRVGEVWSGPPAKIWQDVAPFAGVSRYAFDKYYLGKSTAFALEIRDVWHYPTPQPLSALRRAANLLQMNFVIPQSYRILLPTELNFLQRRPASLSLPLSYCPSNPSHLFPAVVPHPCNSPN